MTSEFNKIGDKGIGLLHRLGPNVLPAPKKSWYAGLAESVTCRKMIFGGHAR